MKTSEYPRKPSEDTRNDFIENNMPLVGFVTAKFIGRGYDYEDLYQYGCIGLIKAADRFDPSYGVAFSTYAVPLIIGEIKRFLRSDGTVHVSRTIRENAIKIMKVFETEEGQGRRQTLNSVCLKTGIDYHDAVLAISALRPVKSLSEPVAGDGDIQLQDVIGNDDGEILNDNIAISQAMKKLSQDERELIFRRYYKRHTQTAIAQDLGLTQVQISRMEKKVLSKLKIMLT